MSFAFAEICTAVQCFYPVFLPEEEEPGQKRAGESDLPPISEDNCESALVGQSPGMAVAAHFRCRNCCLGRGAQGRKQDLSNSLNVVALNPSVGHLHLKC